MRGAALLMSISLGACVAEPAGRAAEARGLGDLPRIMSMSPCLDAILVQVADPAQIVSISHYSHDPASTSMPLQQARRFPVNHDTAEEVIALRPSFVLLGPHVSPATQAAIRSAGVRIESIGVAGSIAESRSQIMTIARVAGHEARGTALVSRIDAALAQARPEPGSPAVPALIRLGGGLVPGAGTLADALLAHTGFRNLSSDYGLAMWDMLPFEPLIARPPRVLLTDLSARRGQPAPLLRAAGVGLVDFPESLLQCAGPSLIEAAGRLSAIRREMAAS
jgi:iron complex transport system substrate-binding protein